MAKKIYIGITPRYRWSDHVGTGADTIWFNETMLGTNYSLNPDTGEVRIENGVIATSSTNPVGLFFVSGKNIRQVTGIITTSTDRLRVNTKVYTVEEITDGSAVSVAIPVKNSYIGIDGVARKITKAYIGDSNNKARLFWERVSK